MVVLYLHRDSSDHIQWIDDISKRFAHFSAVFISDQRVKQNLGGKHHSQQIMPKCSCPAPQGALTCLKGSCPVSSVPSITILATQKKIRSLPVSRMELG